MSDISIFEKIQSTPIADSFIPLSSLAIFEEVKFILGSFADHIYYCPNAMPQFFYWHDFVWVDLWGIDAESIQNTNDKEMLTQYSLRAESLKEKGDYKRLFTYLDKKARLLTFIREFKAIPSEQRYDIFRMIYWKAEYGFSQINPILWGDIIASRKRSAEWKKAMNALKAWFNGSSMVTIYRGEGRKSALLHEAWSWTLSFDVAKFFATRFEPDGIVYETKVSMNDIIDYIAERGEYEVLIPPKTIKLYKKHHVSKQEGE